jgi:molybdenum cofactor cytidylyltransferase
LVVTSHLKALIQALNNPTDILITAYTDTQGVPAIFGKAHFNSILELRDETGAKSIIQTHKEQVGKVAFPGPYRDIDTLEAYESIKKEVWS